MREFIIIIITLLGLFDRIKSVDSNTESTEAMSNKQSEDFGVYKKVISMPGAPKSTLPYNAAIQIDHILYLSGQIGVDPVTRLLVSDDVINQTQQVLHNIRAVLHAAGSDVNQIARCLILLTDINDYQSVNTVYGSFFHSTEDYPARTTFAVKSLPANAKIEIQCTAYIRSLSNNPMHSNCYEHLAFSPSFILLGLVFHILLQ